MATFTDNKEQLRREFKGLAALYKSTKANLGSDQFNILSMGMSGDYIIAVEEGATIVRVGTALFA